MKKHCISIFLAFLIMPLLTGAKDFMTIDSTGLPGDHFSLEGALELLKKSGSPEEFEKSLNTENNYVNNLDLNEDGEIDYIRVIDNLDENAHALILQVPVNETESQDIAVIEIEKTGTEEAILQIIGDELLYGEEVIVEPYEIEAEDNGKGPFVEIDRIVVNVWVWPSVRFMYAPGYRVWISPFRWRHYPVWWKPWRPHPLHVLHPHRTHFRTHYHVVKVHRVPRAHKVYTPRRTTSRVVHTRTTSRTVVRGNKAVTGKKTTTTAVGKKGKNGAVAGKKSTTTTKAKGKGGKTTGKKTTTTKMGKKGKKGSAVKGKRTTKTVKKKRNKG